MLFSYKYHFLFIHTAKTGGTSLRRVLRPYAKKDPIYWAALPGRIVSKLSHHRTATMLPRHGSALTAYEMLPSEEWDGLFKFAFVRNPWDLQVSSYHHIEQEAPHILEGIDDFNAFIAWKFDGSEKPYHVDIANHPQANYVCDHDGQLMLDFIGRYERLANDAASIFEKLNIKAELPHERKASKRKDWRSYYSDASAERVADIFKKDLDLFGYSWDEADL